MSTEHEQAIESLLYIIRHSKVKLDRSESNFATLINLCGGLNKVWKDQNAFNVITIQAGGKEAFEVIHNFEGRNVATVVSFAELLSRLEDPGHEA